MWYKNVATTMVTLILPLTLLFFWNSRTSEVMKRRSRLRNRPQTSRQLSDENPFIQGQVRASTQAKNEEARKAKVLFAIVFMFFACNIPRIILNLEESYNVFSKNYNMIMNSDDEDDVPCYSAPYWTLMLNCFSQFLIVVNASVCSLVYCVMDRIFRSKVMNLLADLKTGIQELPSKLTGILKAENLEVSNANDSNAHGIQVSNREVVNV